MEQQKTIVIIDDDLVILDTARRLLERDGLRVVVYSEGFNATNFAARQRPVTFLSAERRDSVPPRSRERPPTQ